MDLYYPAFIKRFLKTGKPDEGIRRLFSWYLWKIQKYYTFFWMFEILLKNQLFSEL
jgi:hypothetical protein